MSAPGEAASHMIYAGIDEAGYGPRIGPLTVGLSVFRVPLSASDASNVDDVAPPCLWKRLRTIVGKANDSRRKRKPVVFVDDSKRLKGANGLKTRHPLERLEQSVLAFLACSGVKPCTDLELFDAFGASLELGPWYGGDAHPCPVTTTREHLNVMSAAVGAGLRASAVSVEMIRCELLGEAQFNELVAESGSKAVVNFRAATSHLRRVWNAYGHETAYIAMDRQGGRVCYGRPLAAAFPEAIVHTRDEQRERSVYEIVERTERASSRRRMIVSFEIESDQKHFPTALASMTAKLVRELSMARLNRYWCDRVPSLKPTAGYGADAARWLQGVEPYLQARDRFQLVRQA